METEMIKEKYFWERQENDLKDNEIYMIQGTDYKEMTKEILKKSELVSRIPQKSSRIGIKPNLVSPSDPSMGGTTHPEVVAGIIEYLREYGYENLVILEGSWVGDRTAESVIASGFDRLLEKYNVPFVDTQKDTYQIQNCKGLELEICDSVRTVDFLINVPVMKGHCQTKITCALKNMKGLIPNKEKRHFHSMGLHKPIAHLNCGIHQDFIVVDSICGDWDFEDGGNPVVLNRIMTSADPVLCDAYVCNLMGYEQKEVPYLGLAEKLGVGCADLRKMKMVFCNQFHSEEVTPGKRKVVEVQDAVEEVESCSACYGYLIPVLDRLREEGLLEKLEDKICIGQGYRGQTGKLGIGACTRNFEHSLGGCPPMPEQIYEFLKSYIETE